MELFRAIQIPYPLPKKHLTTFVVGCFLASDSGFEPIQMQHPGGVLLAACVSSVSRAGGFLLFDRKRILVVFRGHTFCKKDFRRLTKNYKM